MKLITYGKGSKLNINKFNEIKNQRYNNKPSGGLWASPIDAGYGWKQWGEMNDWGDFDTQFTFQIKGNILKIDSYEDFINKMPIIEVEYFITEIDFEQLRNQGIDAIWLTAHGEAKTRFSKPSLYGWDCECVLILNKRCIMEE